MIAAWGLVGARVEPISSGHINRTYRVVPPGRDPLVLQRLSPIFGVEVNEDIAAITAELERAGLLTPRPVPTADGALWLPTSDGPWRALTCIEGETLLQVDSPARCAEAGGLLGRFHAALWSCTHRFRHLRLGVHDTPRHLATLREALEQRADHRLHAEVAPVGRAILEEAGRVGIPGDLPLRVVHGDPKISNVIFGPDGAARALVDLDTLARMPLPVELGDALRSWCAPAGEEREGPFDLALYRAALGGYAGGVGQRPTEAERAAIPDGVALVAVELAARFCADALRESYFGWDRARFGSAAEHNLARARSQLFLARDVGRQLGEMRRIARGRGG